MPPTFITDNNVLRLSPLMQAVAASKGATPSTVGDDGADPSGGSVGSPVSQLPPGVDPKQVADAQAKAASGDKDAIDWLKTIGVGVGVPAAGYAVYKALKSIKGKTNSGPDSVAPGVTINAKSEVVTTPSKKIDLYIDRSITPRDPVAGYIPSPVNQIEKKMPVLPADLANAAKNVRRLLP